MFLESADGVRAEELCVYHAQVPAGHVIDFSQSTAPPADLLFCLKRGAAALCYEGTPLLAVGKAFCFPREPAYSLTFSAESEIVLISFRLFRQDARLSLPRELSLFGIPADAVVRMEETAAMSGTAGDLRRREAFFAILAAILPELNGNASPRYARIAPGAAALEAQFMESTAISVYASLCGLRENRFRLLFTEQFGVSPVEYRNMLRMRYAHDLMDRMGCSVRDAARAAGFSSVSYFCRLHRKMFGTSPGGMEEQDDSMVETL